MHSPPAQRRSRQSSEGGVAILAVITFVVLITAMVFEFTANTTVDTFAAANARDSMRAHFLNRSGANLGQLIVRVQTDVMDRYRKYLGDIQLADYTSFFMGAFGGGPDEVAAIGEMMGGLTADAIEGLGVSVGRFDVQIGTEDGKLNLNCANGSQETRTNLRTLLEALFFFDAFNPIFETEDADGWRRDRSEQVSAIMDFIDRDRSKADAPGSPEDYGYEALDDDYKAHDGYLDSLEELRLVRGIDDRFWTLFGGEFTIYGECKVNIGALTSPKLIAALIFLAAKNPDDPVVRDPQKLWRLAKRVAESRGMSVTFDDLNAFAEFVKSPDGAMDALLAGGDSDNPLAAAESAAAAAAAQNLEAVEGVELDAKKLAQVAKAGPRRTYRVEVTSEVGRLKRHLTAIWDTQVQNQNMRDPAYARGSWVFWREE